MVNLQYIFLWEVQSAVVTFPLLLFKNNGRNKVHLHHTTINLSAPIVQAKSRRSIAHWR